MAFRVAASRPHAAEVQRVTPDRVALQEEAQSVRERKLALEEAMREERSRRLQHAAQKKLNAAPQMDTVRSDNSAEPQAAGTQPPAPSSAAAPKDVNEYRRELDSANGNKEVYRLHYYTSGHINPADVHFYKAKGKVREYQRHAPCPPRLQSPPRHSTRHDEEGEQEPLAIMPPPGESTAEQWTKSALLRMQANQRILKRIQAREKREAAYAAARSGMRATSAQRKQSEPSQPQPQPPRARTPPRAVLSVLEPRQTSTAAPAASVPTATGINSWRSTLASTTPAVTLQRSPPRRLSPPRPYFASSPLRRFSDDTSPPQHPTLHSSPFKPSLTYSSSSLHASRVEPANPISGATSRERRAKSPWRPLADSWSFTPQHAYQPIAQQDVASSTPWESRRAWEGLTRRSSPPQSYKDDASALFSKPRPSFEMAAVAKEKAEVEVSPLTPSPSVKTAPRSRGQEAGEAVTAGALVNTNNVQQRPSLLAGFRMPETLLKREDLFQGTT